METQKYLIGDVVWWIPTRAMLRENIKNIPFSNEQDWTSLLPHLHRGTICCVESVVRLEGTTKVHFIRYSVRDEQGEEFPDHATEALYKTEEEARQAYLEWASRVLSEEAFVLHRQYELYTKCRNWMMEQQHKLEVTHEQ